MFGWLRHILLSIIFVVVLVLLVAGNLFLTLGLSLSYENVKSPLKDLVKETALGQINTNVDISEVYTTLNTRCVNDPSSNFSFDKDRLVVTLTCQDIAGASQETFLDVVLDKAIYSYYYNQEKLQCGFFTCFLTFAENPTLLISVQSYDFWMAKFYWTITVVFVLLGISFILFEHHGKFLTFIGSLFILSSLPFMKLKLFFPSSDSMILSVISLLFSQSKVVFFLALIPGFVFIVAGIVLYIIDKTEEEILQAMKSK